MSWALLDSELLRKVRCDNCFAMRNAFSKRSWCAISFLPMKFLVEVSTLWKVAVSNFAMEPVYIILLNLLTPSSTAQLGVFNTLWTHIFSIRCIFRPLRFAGSMPGFLKMCLLSATGIFKLIFPGSITFTDRKTPPITIVILNEVIIPFSSWFYQSRIHISAGIVRYFLFSDLLSVHQ